MQRREERRGVVWSRVLSLTVLTAVASWTPTICGAEPQLPACLPSDFHYEYTECDSSGGRWRVSVPTPDTCVGGAPAPPIRGRGCQFTCEAGQYLDINDQQQCLQCPRGTYSVGGGVRFDDWETLPAGFTVKTEHFNLGQLKSGLGLDSSTSTAAPVNCSRISWVPKNHFVSSLAGDCFSTLIYTANLVKQGKVSFDYQLTDGDTYFVFEVQNSACQSSEKGHSRYPSMTDHGEWKRVTMSLKSGLNILYWRTVGISSDDHGMTKPVRVKNIEITGVAYTSECTKCSAGSFSDEGASQCKLCPAGTFSQKGDKECSPCDDKTQYSKEGAHKCTDRPACTPDDYFEYHLPCDTNNQTRMVYKWLEPKRCREDLKNAITLPEPGAEQPCPPCNVGMELKKGKCQFCPHNQFSDGSTECRACPASTAPKTKLSYVWWNNLPEDANLTINCLSLNDEGCSSDEGWVPSLDHIHSGKGQVYDAYLILSLDLAGFKGQEQFIKGKPYPVGEISFVFETICRLNCSFFFMMQRESDGTSIVKSWAGKQGKQLFSYRVLNPGPVSFTWAFQKENWHADAEDPEVATMNDVAKIFSINVTNSLDGGASDCKVCPKGTSADGCIACPAGSFIDSNSSQCRQCPKNTVVQSSSPWGQESCVPCGEGLTTIDNVHCVSTCSYMSPEGKEYNFDGLSSPRVVQGSSLFTSSGTQYYHVFNISLCAGGEYPLSSCYDNISYVDSNETQRTTDEKGDVLQAAVCRMTIIPPSRGDLGPAMAAQPSSLGDVLVSITTNSSGLNIKERMSKEGFDMEDSDLDVHLSYVSNSPTTACKNGRSTLITMRCDISEKDNGTIYLPPHCAQGTCDGCNFHLLWKSRQACPICKKETYEVIKGECINGEQKIIHQPPRHCIILDDKKPLSSLQKCSIFPFWLQVSLMIVAVTVVLMCVLLVYCWKRSRKLEYKYMKLVESSSGHELPQAETCAIDEDDMEEEEFDAVQVKDNKGKKFFKRLKLMAGKQDDDDELETYMMNEKEPLT